MMSRSDMASFSDAHECPEIPLIAADLHRLILPRQSQIWAVIRQDDSIRRIIWSLSAALLGRMCISGQVARLNEAQMQAIREGVDFYRQAAPVIRKGSTRVIRRDITAYDHAHGWQAAIRTGEDAVLLTVHAFEHNGGEWTLPQDFSGYAIDRVYCDSDCRAELANGSLTCHVGGEYCGLGVLLRREAKP